MSNEWIRLLPGREATQDESEEEAEEEEEEEEEAEEEAEEATAEQSPPLVPVFPAYTFASEEALPSVEAPTIHPPSPMPSLPPSPPPERDDSSPTIE